MAAPASASGASEVAGAKDPFWAPALVVGLAGFGTTTMLAGIAIASNGANWGTTNGVVFPMALAFGGTAQFIAGLIMLRRGEIFPGSAFVGYGAFWWAFTLFLSGLVGTAFGPQGSYNVMWFMIVWLLWTLSFTINAPKHGWGVTAVFVLLLLAYILLSVDFGIIGGGHTVPNAMWTATGVETFIDGLVAWYVATGILTAAHHNGRKVLPY